MQPSGFEYWGIVARLRIMKSNGIWIDLSQCEVGNDKGNGVWWLCGKADMQSVEFVDENNDEFDKAS